MNKKLLFLLLITILLMVGGFVYWYYYSEPNTTPSHGELMKQIDRAYEEAEIAKVQDAILVDERHLFVPYISKDNDYGTSFFVWKKRKWELEAVNSVGQPILWKIDSDDPSFYKIVWNFHPDDQFQSAQFYLLRNRGYEVTQGIEYYYPKVQLMKKVKDSQTSYGIDKLPKDWVSIIHFANSVQKTDSMSDMFLEMDPNQQFTFAWQPVFQKETDEDIFSKRSINGGGFSSGGNYDPITLLEEQELESKE
ncbi:hypothetical protein QUF49_13835 [Fictibacillus sp. b24]|uniref:hypothetical protein n=1 Tax=Fictibacillus sp. b24 TaxID=3055863 RepID=UPI0025A2B23E|nr:hypothetical protein [Fictibacillus sp. b24]MDM5317083.1 hypothetical protein [Fictibacillus sp. b24]